MNVDQHQKEILLNLRRWEEKPLLRRIYHTFNESIASHLSSLPNPLVVEIGSGIGNIKDVIPGCVRTDMFPNPWIDQVENAYKLSFADGSVSDLILFDVFHHLRYPGTAFDEFARILRPGGRVIIFDPYISLFGWIIYGLCHPEPISWRKEIMWNAPKRWSAQSTDYYAAQGNVTRIFFSAEGLERLKQWKVLHRKRTSAFSYVASGGYSGPQLYPESLYPIMRILDRILDFFPSIFASRALVIIEKIQ